MIVVCDLLCRGLSHEKVNSGFLSGLRLAFPEDKIVFFADATHIAAIKSILQHDGVEIHQIEYREIRIRRTSFAFNIVNFHFGLMRIFSDIVCLGVEKIFFLSFDLGSLFVIKKLKEQSRFAHIKCAFVLHGAFEEIAGEGNKLRAINLPRNSIPIARPLAIAKKIRKIGLGNLFNGVLNRLPKLPLPRLLVEFFSLKKLMEWRHSSDYRYISLSPHVTANAARYLDTSKLNFYTVILPTNFVKFAPAPHNKYPKFAIFGYGDSLVLHNVAYALSLRRISSPYEIRVIGMDNRGTDGFHNFTCSSPGKPLDRSEMEMQAEDIDAFLILYDKSKYQLSCSGSILEAISMGKPIIHFDNDCINYFNKSDSPIGFRCDHFDEYIDRLVDVIENYEQYRQRFAQFRENILRRRIECSILSSVPVLKESFEWEAEN